MAYQVKVYNPKGKLIRTIPAGEVSMNHWDRFNQGITGNKEWDMKMAWKNHKRPPEPNKYTKSREQMGFPDGDMLGDGCHWVSSRPNGGRDSW